MELLQFMLPTRISFLNTTKKNPILFSLIHSKPKPIRTTGLIAADAAPKEPSSESDSVPAAADWKSKGSPQLSRWSRARSIRSGRRLVRSSPPKLDTDSGTAAQLVASQDSFVMYRSDDEDEREVTVERAGKAIYMVSDGTGWTAEHSVNAALGQFEHCLVDRACAVNTHLFSAVEGEERLIEIIKQAAVEGALVLYTLADPNMAEAAKQACRLWGVPYTDILGPTTEAIATHLGVNPMGVPRGKAPLTREYFRRIEAIEFTIKQDDGAQPQNLHKADIVLVGVSRTGKTPLSIYLAQKGYRVANVPIVMGVEVPKTVFQIDQDKVFALTINPIVLQTIRKARAKTLGFGSGDKTNYWNMDHIKQELEYCGQIFGQNPGWPVIEVTGKAIEETAAVVVRIYHDRKQKCWIPRISKRY